MTLQLDVDGGQPKNVCSIVSPHLMVKAEFDVANTFFLLPFWNIAVLLLNFAMLMLSTKVKNKML